MKTLLIIGGVVLAAFVGTQIYFINDRSNIEKYPFKVVKDYKDFEIRDYESTLFTSVKLSSSEYDKASSQGFRILGNYIFGGNEKKQKIAMTSPVAMSMEDSMRVMFMVPKDFNKETLPKPNQSSIEFREEPAKTVAAISFGGWANDEKIDKYKEKLTKALDAKGIAYTNKFYFLGYNAPFELINRKNEIIVELEDFSLESESAS